MEKPIRISEPTWRSLINLKYSLDISSIDKVIRALLLTVEPNNLEPQLKKIAEEMRKK